MPDGGKRQSALPPDNAAPEQIGLCDVDTEQSCGVGNSRLEQLRIRFRFGLHVLAGIMQLGRDPGSFGTVLRGLGHPAIGQPQDMRAWSSLIREPGPFGRGMR